MKRVVALLAVLTASLGALQPTAVSAMTYSPPTFDFIVEPGKSVTDAVKLRNDGSAGVHVTARTANFRATPGDEVTGTPEFYSADERGDGHGLAAWMQVLNPDQTLAAGDTGSVMFEIRVPQDASPGSYFGAVVVRTEGATEGESGVGVVADAALLVLLRVQGEVVEELKLASFAPDRSSFSSLPVGFEARVENLGTVHLRPYGEITVKDMLGRVAAIVPINRQEYKSVLPTGARRYQAVWTREGIGEGMNAFARQWKGFALGRYTADLSMTYGDRDDKTMVASSAFWVVPWMPLLALAAVAAAAWALLKTLIARWKRTVIRSYEKAKTDEGEKR